MQQCRKQQTLPTTAARKEEGWHCVWSTGLKINIYKRTTNKQNIKSWTTNYKSNFDRERDVWAHGKHWKLKSERAMIGENAIRISTLSNMEINEHSIPNITKHINLYRTTLHLYKKSSSLADYNIFPKNSMLFIYKMNNFIWTLNWTKRETLSLFLE